MLVMVGAAIQLLSPGVAAVADGLLARESASQPLTHIEATTTAKCPVVHAPDCGVCRYLSTGAALARTSGLVALQASTIAPACAATLAPASVVTTLPNGRAPPVA
jgi:hypothetical protein